MKENIANKRKYFNTNITKSYEFRRSNLLKLRKALVDNEIVIYEALKKDLNKSHIESYLTEFSLLKIEINYMLKNLKRLMKNRKRKTPLSSFLAKSLINYEPFGVVLIIAPWNYPFLLSIAPLVGVIAAGNCAIIKPSEISNNAASTINNIISNTFDRNYIEVIEGDKEIASKLLDEKFDYIFYTGGKEVGKIVMKKAANHLTPVTLELGGKSPVIIDKSVNLEIAARRIAFGKFLNAGQTCIAPDYVYVYESLKEEFIKKIKEEIKKMYYKDEIICDNYPKIINLNNYMRLNELIKESKIVIGGNSNLEKLIIEPTLVIEESINSVVMKEEIFGPILPIFGYIDLDLIINSIKSKEKPLALYLFSSDKKVVEKVLNEISFGGGCVNDTVIHINTPYLPFGGVGNSGMGSYRGDESFYTFSNSRGILKKSTKIDFNSRYHPYDKKKIKLLKKIQK